MRQVTCATQGFNEGKRTPTMLFVVTGNMSVIILCVHFLVLRFTKRQRDGDSFVHSSHLE